MLDTAILSNHFIETTRDLQKDLHSFSSWGPAFLCVCMFTCIDDKFKTDILSYLHTTAFRQGSRKDPLIRKLS